MKDYKKRIFTAMLLILSASIVQAQNLKSKSVGFEVDLTEEKNLKNSSVPFITWIAPANETVFLTESRLHTSIEITSETPIKEVRMSVKLKNQPTMRGNNTINPKENQRNRITIEREITMMEGINLFEIVVENIDGVISRSFRIIHVGETALADAAKLNRKDIALIFATDKYDNWTPLVNPIYDARAIASLLEKYYGYQVELIENPSQDVIFSKLREYSEKEYEPLDQLMIFFAGHGYYDEGFKEGFVVVKESLIDDPGKTSYVSYNRLRNILNVIPAEHILLMMDVCFGGTFDDAIANARGAEEVYAEVSQSDYLLRKLSVKTRKYLTSGGKEYVSDGIPGKHSPFSKNVIEALNSFGGSDGILTLNELYPYVEKLTPEPRVGKFGDNAPGSEFVFVVK